MQTIYDAINFVAEYYSLFWIVSVMMSIAVCYITALLHAVKMGKRSIVTVLSALSIVGLTVLTTLGNSPIGMLMALFGLMLMILSLSSILFLIVIKE